MKRREAVLSGAKTAVPIVLGYLPVGVAYGLLAVQSRLTPLEALSMSSLRRWLLATHQR